MSVCQPVMASSRVCGEYSHNTGAVVADGLGGDLHSTEGSFLILNFIFKDVLFSYFT